MFTQVTAKNIGDLFSINCSFTSAVHKKYNWHDERCAFSALADRAVTSLKVIELYFTS